MENVLDDLLGKALFRLDEVAACLRVSRKTVYRWYNAGDLEGTKLRGSLMIHRASILKFLKDDSAASSARSHSPA